MIKKHDFAITLLFAFIFSLFLGTTAEAANTETAIVSLKTFNNIPPEKPPFFQHKIMSHALGGLEEKYIYSNALEGLEQSVSLGYKLIEVDLILTADDRLVACHGWNEKTYHDTGVAYNPKNMVMTYEQFMNTKIQGKYTTIDATKMVEYLKEYPDLYFEFDLRTLDRNTSIKTAKAIVEVFRDNMNLLDRVLIQIGNPDMYEGFNSVHSFKYYQYFIHKSELKNIDEVILFCKTKGIVSVAARPEYLTDTLIKKLKFNHLSIIVHTIDDVQEARRWLEKGIDIVCTNFITYEDL
ncbi:glycerophosphodiester phosphodiesterase family protein [Bacillus sp. 31A1R]|uniref:Glycerophosphodiester phosphodiesterase family protein n=1 Tax=Robertmurraya mangrovi TaxID=3098077 RepID=A0ABU5J1Q6_9BACI|nr:glycerophosphodiester phosphodiesterase family protein [Bacillus sp. 31A1R]MDZ5473355.1 glycerophosphodiester phosphodiesterase family protein [Bacillus sp. 31A1R]